MKRAALLPLVLAAACAGAPPPPAGPPSGLSGPPAARPVAAEPAEAAAPAVASEPPAAPADLSAVIRVANPLRAWGDATRLLATTPLGFLLMGAAQMGPDLLAEEALGPALADLVDLEQPVDVAFLGTSGDAFTVSLAVREREVPRLHDRLVLKEVRGLLRVEGVRDPDPEARKLPAACALDVGERRGGTRLVCAPTPEGLAAAPYLAEVVAREPIDADVRVEIRTPALASVLEDEQRKADQGDPDDRSERLGRELASSFTREIEGVTLDLTWAGQDVELGLGLRLSGRTSPLSLALAPASKPDAPPPAAFPLLPRDAGLALYTQGASKDELAPLRARFFEVLLENVVEDGLDRAKAKVAFECLGKLILTGGSLVLAAGVDRARLEKALAAYEDKKGDAKAREAARSALGAWLIVGAEDPPGPWIDNLKDLVRLSNDLTRSRRNKAGGAAKKKDEEKREETEWVIGRAPASLPAGTLHVELRSRPSSKKGGPPPHTSHLYAVPAGGRLWIGASADDAAVVARLRAVVTPAQAGQTLAGAPELAALGRPGSTAGGFASIFGGAALITGGDTPEDLDEAAHRLGLIGGLAARGETPIPWAITSEVLPTGAARWGLRVRLPGPAIQDAVQAITR